MYGTPIGGVLTDLARAGFILTYNPIAIVQGLNTDAVCQKMKLEMRTSGIKSIPRGIKKSTQSNLALLTERGTRCFTTAKRRFAEQRNC